MHHVLVRAIITGFGFSLGVAIYKKVARQLGLEDEPPRTPQVERNGGGGETAVQPA
jgi:hypothetical protein